jgi:catechol 2,3-dioxygenase-like lactoylglutathione lyase family enzyme
MDLPNLGSTNVAQIAIVVRDIDEACRRWSDVLGQPIPKVIVTEPGNEVAMTYKGAPSNARAKLAFFSLGPVQLELIEPLGGASTWQKALDSRGEHVQHIAFWVEGMQASVDFLRERGIAMTQRGDMMEEGQYAYFDSEERLGVTLELLERKRNARAV